MIRALLFRLDPERAHHLAFGLVAAGGPLARGLAGATCGQIDPRLRTTLAGLELPGPVGLAAGLDKDGQLTRFWPKLGFGFVELGTVTTLPQPGNPRPRLFRFPEQGALVNRMGFNNRGSEALAARLAGRRRRDGEAPLGVNLGKSKVTPLDQAPADYAASTRRLAPLADYLVINVSSPNTPGLRTLQDSPHLEAVLAAVRAEASGRPVFVKLAPDLSEDALVEVVAVCEEGEAAGIIATNTTVERHGLPDVGPGGLSGLPLRSRSLEVIAHVRRHTRLPIVGVGGIATARHVIDAFAAGADAVQIYTAFIYGGPGLVRRIHKGLLAAMEVAGLRDLDALKDAARAGLWPRRGPHEDEGP